MKFIDKIRSFLRKDKEKNASQKTAPNNIGQFLDEKNQEIGKSLNEKSENLYKELSVILNKLKENTKILISLDLTQRKADYRIKQITELGKKDYTVHLNKLIDNLEQKKDIFHLSKSLDKFLVESEKSHFKATQLIGKEIENIMNNIKELRKLEKNFLKNNDNLIKEKENIKLFLEKINEIKQEEKKIENIKLEIENINQDNSNYKRKIEELDKKITHTKESEGYKKQENLAKDKNQKQEALDKIKTEIKELLDKKYLEKYAYVEQDKKNKKISISYIEDPISALFLDENLDILTILNEIKNRINANKISLKSPSKILEKINIAIESLSANKSRILQLNEEISSLNKELSETKTNLYDLIVEGSSMKNKLEENEKILSLLNKKHEKIYLEISELKSSLAQEVLKTIQHE